VETRVEHSTYSTNEYISKVVFPKLEAYLPRFLNELQKQNLLSSYRKDAYDWINNQVKSEEILKLAKSDEKRMIEGSYAVYLALKANLQGQSGEGKWVDRFRTDAERGLKVLDSRKPVSGDGDGSGGGKGLIVRRFTKDRKKLLE